MGGRWNYFGYNILLYWKHYRYSTFPSVACASYDGYSITSSYDRGEEIIGDTNGSGEIEIVDATFIQRSLSYIRTPYTKDELLRGDVDDSGELEIIDATAIQYYLANMKTLYNIGESI